MSDDKPLEYWAAAMKSEEVVSSCITRVRRYRESLRVSGRADRMRRTWMAYLGWGPRMDADASRAQTSGQSGEMVSLNVNQFAAMVNQAVVLTTSNKPAVKAIPANGDFESIAQAQFAESLNDYYDRELAVSDREREGALNMVLLSETWEVLDWDATAGSEYMPDEAGKPVKSGDVRLFCLTPFDVAVDPDVHDCESYTWFAWRRRVNRFDLAAQFPNQRVGILAARKDGALDDVVDNNQVDFELRRKRSTQPESDCVYVWELRHLPTPALPNGRLVKFIDSRTVLSDSLSMNDAGQPVDFGYPHAKLHAYTAAPERVPGAPDGHTSFFDLLSLQEGLDLCASIMMSAINAGGLQNLFVPRGANVTATKLGGALNIIEYDGAQLPQAKENVAINPAVNAFAEMCVQWARQRVSLNDVVMGEPSKGMPAQAMALLRAQAVEFHSHLQAAYERLIQRTRTGILEMLQKYADTERVALIGGKANAWALKHFTKKDIEHVARYVVEPINPIMKTLAGKVSFAQPLLEAGKITVQQYFQLTETGRMEPVLRFEQDNQARVTREKEMLMRGIGLPPIQMGPMGPVLDAQGMPAFVQMGEGEFLRPLITDTHWSDIPEYLSVLAMPEVRDNPAVVKAVTEVVHLKTQMWRMMDPAIIMVLKGQLPPPPMPAVALNTPPPVGGEEGGTMPPLPGATDTTQPKPVKPPKNPITGEQDLPAAPN